MAQVTVVAFADDLDGSKAAETVSFALDGVPYEIDLSAKHAKAIRKDLAEFVAAARTVNPAGPFPRAGRRSGRAGTGVKRAVAGASNADIRSWAVAQRIAVGDRGRISEAIRQQYRDAHR